MATTFGVRASDLVLDERPDAALRFDLDRAVALFGGWVERRTDAYRAEPVGTGKQRRQHTDAECDAHFRGLLGLATPAPAPRQRRGLRPLTDLLPPTRDG